MAPPITGPFVKNIYVKGPPNQYGYMPDWKSLQRTWYRQVKPYDRVLPFELLSREVTWSLNSWSYTQREYDVKANPYESRYVDRVYRTAYADFLDKTRSSSAELLTLFCERREAANMIAKRSLALATGFIAVRQRNIHALKKAWGKGAGWRENGRKAGSHILEYSFGWAPLVSDIASAVETLRDGNFRSGKARHRSIFRDLQKSSNGSMLIRETWSTSVGIRMGWEITVDHPSIALLNQLGLLNPVQTAWELVPYSFVVDYFINVNDVISSMTALAGCTLHRPWFTTMVKDDYAYLATWAEKPVPSWRPPSMGGTRVRVSRATNIVPPSLGVRAPWNLSWQRASTSIALLLQQLH